MRLRRRWPSNWTTSIAVGPEVFAPAACRLVGAEVIVVSGARCGAWVSASPVVLARNTPTAVDAANATTWPSEPADELRSRGHEEHRNGPVTVDQVIEHCHGVVVVEAAQRVVDDDRARPILRERADLPGDHCDQRIAERADIILEVAAVGQLLDCCSGVDEGTVGLGELAGRLDE